MSSGQRLSGGPEEFVGATGGGSGARASARANMRRMGLENIDIGGKSYNSGRKALEAKGFRYEGQTPSGRQVFYNPKTGATVSYDPASGGRPAHWHITDVSGLTYSRYGNVVHSSEGAAHIPAGP